MCVVGDYGCKKVRIGADITADAGMTISDAVSEFGGGVEPKLVVQVAKGLELGVSARYEYAGTHRGDFGELRSFHRNNALGGMFLAVRPDSFWKYYGSVQFGHSWVSGEADDAAVKKAVDTDGSVIRSTIGVDLALDNPSSYAEQSRIGAIAAVSYVSQPLMAHAAQLLLGLRGSF